MYKKGYFLFASSIFIITIIYVIVFLDDPRMADGSLDYSEAYIWEMILLTVFPFLTFHAMYTAAKHAYKAGRKWLAVLSVIAWPFSYIYLGWAIYFDEPSYDKHH